jgi:DNA gyrase subunit A
MLVTDQAKMIRMSVGDTRVIGRNSAGVRLFNVAENEHVVSAARIEESEEEGETVEETAAETVEVPDGAGDE